jgi:hypothetical protein
MSASEVASLVRRIAEATHALALLTSAAVVQIDPVRFICPPAFESAVRAAVRFLFNKPPAAPVPAAPPPTAPEQQAKIEALARR